MVYYMVLEKAHYKFNETSGTDVIDSSGNGNNGTNDGATINQTGKIGKAYSFTGGTGVAADYVAVDSDLLDDIGFAFGVRRDIGDISCYLIDGWYESTGNTISINTWYHYVFVSDHDNSKVYLYLNNNLIETFSKDFGVNKSVSIWGYSTSSSTTDRERLINMNEPVICIGTNNDGISDIGWVGKIDDTRFYDFALTKKDISLLYNLGNGTEIDLETLRNRADFFSLSLGAEI